MELLIAVARRIAPGSLVMIGFRAMEIDVLPREKSVRYLEPEPYETLPRYTAHFDVGIMPWLQNEWIAKCNPIKLKELVHAASSHEEFMSQFDRALADRDPQRVEQRRKRVLEDSWENVADRAAELLRLAHHVKA